VSILPILLIGLIAAAALVIRGLNLDTPSALIATPPATQANQPSPTPSRTPSPTTPTPTTPAMSAIASNAEWTPIEEVLDGVSMVRVPPGCFMMGTSTDSGGQQCFDVPFWIDKTEVTQAQFRDLGGVQTHPSEFVGDNRPVDSILWQEANEYCLKRGGRLPTEAEWEYAARGPDGKTYPWGDTFTDDLSIFGRDSTLATAEVGSLPAGVSWVGALDMSGNVSEWTTSRYRLYPYDANDGREAIDPFDSHTIRGGSWNDGRHSVSAVYRIGRRSTNAVNQIGFRCVILR
jgi:formylglycine-generating enzyme required for sulfatase activity